VEGKLPEAGMSIPVSFSQPVIAKIANTAME
jgi:hypothetical protein